MVSEARLLTRSQDHRRRKYLSKKKYKRLLVRLLCTLAWMGFLFTFILVDHFDAYLYQREVHFQWVPHPNFLELFDPLDAARTSLAFWFLKLGHFTGFAILDLLLFMLTKSQKISIMLSICLAVFSEVLQLFFSRDGRVFDMVIDSLGVCTVYIIVKLIGIGKNRAS